MDLTPKTSMLDSQRHQNLPWKLILGEFIDNAFDAGAKRVSFEFNKKSLVIVDDGEGCDDLQRMLTLGDHHEHRETQLGIYGVGAKDAAISAADGIAIVSTKNGYRHSVALNWRQLERSGSWTNCPDPNILATDAPNGTIITLDPLRSDHKPSPETLIKSLSLLYTPAIKSGRQIIVKLGAKKPPLAIPEFRFPPLEHQMTVDLDVNGKSARVTMGVVPETHAVEISGLQISYGYRVIAINSRLGLGESPTPNLFGWIELGKEWGLTKNKDNISGDLTPLGEAINKACRATIEIASKQATNIVFDQVAEQVNAALSDVLSGNSDQKTKKERRNKGDSTGTIQPKGSAKRRRRAAKTQPGSALSDPGGTPDGKASSISVSFVSMAAEGPSCRYQGGVVYLNKDNPIIREGMSDKRAIAIHAIYAVATHLADPKYEGRQRLIFEKQDAEEIVDKMAIVAGKLLAALQQRA